MKPLGRSVIAMAVSLTLTSVAAPAVAGGGHGHYARGDHHRGGNHSRDYGRHHGRDHGRHGDDGVALGVGLLFGMLLGSAIQNSHDRYYDEPVYHGPAYRPAPAWRQAPRAVYSEPPVTIAARPDGTCLQEREYQTRITVDGREVEAYGIACLQPDGSWQQGPARLVPEF